MNEHNTPTRQAALTSFAVVGFIALVVAGVWLAVYATRFVPAVVNRVGSAAIYIGSLFVPSHEGSLSVVPTPSASSTLPSDTTTSPADTDTSSATSPITAGPKKTTTAEIGGGAVAPQPSLTGLPDLQVSVTDIGYLTTNSADSFVASSSVPAGSRPAIKFVIKNVGTNIASLWRFSATIPTYSSYTYTSPTEQNLAPGESVAYTLGFDQARTGADQPITVIANFDNAMAESNTNNNKVTLTLTVLGY